MDDDHRLDQFAVTARAYCDWVEGPASSASEEVDTAVALLSKLCAQVHDLPELFDDEEAQGLTQEQWMVAYRRFASLPFNYYASIDDPWILDDPQPVTGDVADDLADVWRDLMGGLDLYDRGNRPAAAWKWRETFRIHWGRHATGALHVLHCWNS